MDTKCDEVFAGRREGNIRRFITAMERWEIALQNKAIRTI
jgi:hypothetical protein